MRLWKWRSYGNHRTISTGPWKSRTEREIPTFPQAILLVGVRGEERRMNRPRSGSLSERRTGLLSERRLQRGLQRCQHPCRLIHGESPQELIFATTVARTEIDMRAIRRIGESSIPHIQIAGFNNLDIGCRPDLPNPRLARLFTYFTWATVRPSGEIAARLTSPSLVSREIRSASNTADARSSPPRRTHTAPAAITVTSAIDAMATSRRDSR